MLDNIRRTHTLPVRAWRTYPNREQTMTTQTTHNAHRTATVEQLETFRSFIERAPDHAVALLAETAAEQLARNEFASASQRTACELVMEEMQFRRAEDSAQLATAVDA
jgi:hypothetical protein